MQARFPCDLCGSEELGEIVCPAGRNSLLSVVRCPRCSLLHVDPFPSATAILEQYDRNYFCCAQALSGGYENYAEDEPEIRKTFLRRLAFFGSYLPSHVSRRVLDVGCASGVFLEVMKDQGWDASGIDVSQDAVRMAASKGCLVRQASLMTADLPVNAFDLITMWDVIEHFDHPRAALERCCASLVERGCLVLSTPDASAWLAKLLSTRWLGYRSVGEHLYFFTRETITALLTQAGFEVLSITSVGKYMKLKRVYARLKYYTRLFRALLPAHLPLFEHWTPYISSGDTMCVVARKK